MKTTGSHLATLLAGEHKLRWQLAPLVKYVLLLVAVVLLYSWLFQVIMASEGQDHSWLTGVYWALTVMSTLGFGDITFQSDLGRAFSTLVLLTGMVLLLIILPLAIPAAVQTAGIKTGATTSTATGSRKPNAGARGGCSNAATSVGTQYGASRTRGDSRSVHVCRATTRCAGVRAVLLWMRDGRSQTERRLLCGVT